MISINADLQSWLLIWINVNMIFNIAINSWKLVINFLMLLYHYNMIISLSIQYFKILLISLYMQVITEIDDISNVYCLTYIFVMMFFS